MNSKMGQTRRKQQHNDEKRNVIFDNDTSFWDLGFTTLDYGKLIFCIEASYEIDFVNHIRGNHYKVDSVSKICNELKLLVQ